MFTHALFVVNPLPPSIPGSNILFIRHPTLVDTHKSAMNFRICEVKIAVASFQRQYEWSNPDAWMVHDGNTTVGAVDEAS